MNKAKPGAKPPVISKREYMATQMLAALLPCVPSPAQLFTQEDIVALAVNWADRLIDTLNQTRKESRDKQPPGASSV